MVNLRNVIKPGVVESDTDDPRFFRLIVEDIGERLIGNEDILTVGCAWFARCSHVATSLEPHPILGEVPICERCKALIHPAH